MTDRLQLDPKSQPPVYKGTHDHIHVLAVPAVEFDRMLAERAQAKYGKELLDLAPEQLEQIRQTAEAGTKHWARQRRYHADPCPGCIARVGGVPED